jgi:cytochrome d ubiquinol oxidase subunit II
VSATFLDLIWANILAIAIFAYVVMDGFDLGIGMLFPWLMVGDERDDAMNSIAPFWDGNETWLVLGGGGLLAAFPLAYSIILPATYPLIIAMLLGLVFRGVAFEFRWRKAGHRKYWDAAFSSGSFVAALAQGLILGAVLQGIRVEDNAYAGGWLDWLSPFSVLSGVALALGYSLSGATWLIWKTHGPIQDRARRMSFPLAVSTFLAIAAISAATPFLQYDYWHRWLAVPGIYFASQVPLLAVIIAASLFIALRRRAERVPFFMVLALFFVTFVGLGVSAFPYLVPPQVTLFSAAAPVQSLDFMLRGTVVIFPVISAYTVWAHWVFRGKVAAQSYHE